MIEALDCVAMSKTLQPIRTHLDDMLVPFKQAEAIDAELRAMVPHKALDFLVLAWHPDHFGHNSVRLNFCTVVELSDASGQYERSIQLPWPIH